MKFSPIFLFSIGLVTLVQTEFTLACSMYKLTVNDKTLVGCNEDAWRSTSVIWFENAISENEYGAAFTGSRQVDKDLYVPHSGMNEWGLVFSRLTAYSPINESKEPVGKRITNEVDYLKSILHQCKTAREVQRFVAQYDRRFFANDVFIYVDRFGDYLVVEPSQTLLGNEVNYVLSNFCPSITSEADAKKITRYRNGQDFLRLHPANATLAYATALSDTMHVSRTRNGDGTLLTSIWDTKNGLVNLFFYHRFDTTIQFNLSGELAMGNHLISIPELFPPNKDFERLKTYITPFNFPALRVGLVLLAGLLAVLALVFLTSFFFSRKQKSYRLLKLSFALMNLLLVAYLFVLATHINVYYFDAPYKHYNNHWISLSSYVPFVLLVALLIFCFFWVRHRKTFSNGVRPNFILPLNAFIYLLLIAGCFYWGFFDVFHGYRVFT